MCAFRLKSHLLRAISAIAAAAIFEAALAGSVLVETKAEYLAASKRLQPGDAIVLANGVWEDFEILLDAEGTADRPITLAAQDKGKVILSGRSNLRLAGEHLVVRGLVFRDGHTPTKEVIAFRRSKERLANNSRVTEVVVDRFSNPERFETDFWVMMYGKNNRFDHNHLEGKSNAGVTMAVRLDSAGSIDNRHRIDHNYFGPRPILGANGGETLRIGTSKHSLQNSNTVVERNFFDRCNGELEVVSNKSGGNVFRGNLFWESRGTLTLRHGNGNLIEGNVFIGNGVDHAGGVRVINKDQIVRNNYFSGLTGHRFGGALVIMNGVPDSPINRYHRVENALIENNSIIDSNHIEMAAGSDEERSAVPVNSVFRNNLIVNRAAKDSIAAHDDIGGIAFSNNVLSGVIEAPAEAGFRSEAVELKKTGNGLLFPGGEALRGIGAPAGLEVLNKDDTGVSWYPKPGRRKGFDSGGARTIEPGPDALAKAVAAAGPGDAIALLPGEYQVAKIIEVGRPITIKAAQENPKPLVRFERSALFELAEGGSLKLEGLAITGEDAPDAYGNAAIRTANRSLLGNYRLSVVNCSVANLNVNHSFDFFRAGRHTFAHRIEILGSSFSNITGHVLSLAREMDDLGIYNGEYVAIADSSFRNIDKSVANLYRGGTDESTFGPHFQLTGAVLEKVGRGSRNKTAASIRLLGVQRAQIRSNRFLDSEPIRITHTVGDPVSIIAQNKFASTAAPIVTDG